METRLVVTGVDKITKGLDAATKYTVLDRSLREIGQSLAGWSRYNRLTGPRPNVLGVVTGRLRSSITATAPVKRGNAWRILIGTNVAYGRIHELGFFGPVRVNSYVRKTGNIRGGTTPTGRASTRKIGTMLGNVKAHTRVVNMPARPFLRPALEDMGNQKMILEIISNNVANALKKTTEK